MGWWAWVLVVLAVLLVVALVYDRARRGRVDPHTGSRERDHGEGLYRGGLGTNRPQGGDGGGF